MATDRAGPAAVEVRLLGPIEVAVGEGGGPRVVPLGGPRQRALLGLLALRTPAVVSVPYLIEGIWGDDPPPAAGGTLRAHVAYLRRGLAAAGLAGLVATRPPGYALTVPADRVDAHRFERLSECGRAALAAGAPAEAVPHLRAALALWRGEALAGCPTGEWARAEGTRLEEARLYTTEELLAAELTLGQSVRVAAELETLVERHPFRERLWELLMLAQYRGGRQGDALHAYRRARAALVAELGVEPGPALRRMEAMILAGDERLAGPAQPVPVAVPDAVPGAVPVAVPATVPAPITPLVGRQAEIADVLGQLAGRRLVTLTGPGGCGKTRMAIAVADRLAERHDGHVWFVDLSATSAPDAVAATVAAALRLSQRPDLGPAETLVSTIRPLRGLLVLDNCEHLLEGCTPLVGTLLAGCPDLRVLATSREALGVLGESVHPVPPLAVPQRPADAGHRVTLAELRRYDAVRLFLDRAAPPAARHLCDEDAPALAAICAGLDGLPLAIELAAARTDVLTPRQIAARIDDPALLRGRRQGSRPHHVAMHDTMAWSYGLLEPAAQASFRRLAVFAGGFTLDAVAAVWADRRGSAVDLLGDLVARSLVVMDRAGGEARYRLLETVRQYAAERLRSDHDEESAARRNHARYYRSLAERIDADPQGPAQRRLLDTLAADHDNLRTALGWFAAHESTVDELRLAVHLARYCHLRGRYRDGRRWIEDALRRHHGPVSADVAAARLSAARLAFFECDYPVAAARAEQALAGYRTVDEAPGTARALSLLGSVARERGQYPRALARYGEALAAHHRAGDETGIATILQLSGFTSWLSGDLDRAGWRLDQALRRFLRRDDAEGVASARIHLAAVAHYQGSPARARWFATDAMAGFRALDFDEGIAWALNITGLVEHADGAPGAALQALRDSLGIHCALGDRWRTASVLEALAAVLGAGARVQLAAELLQAATAIRAAIDTPVPPQERPIRQAAETALRAALTDREWCAASDRGRTLRLTDLPARVAAAG